MTRPSARQAPAHGAAFLILALSAAVAAAAHVSGWPITAAIIFLLGVTGAGALSGIRGGLLAGAAASIGYNFFLVEPTFRFTLATVDELVPLLAFNLGALASGMLTGRLRDRARAAELANRRLAALLRLSERLQAAVNPADILAAASAYAAGGGAARVELWLPQAGALRPVGGDAAHAAAAQAAYGGGPPVERTGARVTVRLANAAEKLGLLVFGWEASAAVPLFDDLRGVANVAAIALERCLLLQRVAEAELLRKSEELKTALLSSVSHDMRTPLGAISASASSLARYGDELPDQAKADMLATIGEQCARLDRYTTNLLNLGRLQAGVDRELFAPCDALEALGSAIVQAKALGGAHEMVKRIDAADAVVNADPVMLEQVFYNVLENSVRYSAPESAIHVSARVDQGRLVVAIRDFGRGIPAEALPHIFDRFYRAGESHPQGSGLGLAIAKGFTEAFGGRIGAALPEDGGAGTTILVELPLAAAAGEGR